MGRKTNLTKSLAEKIKFHAEKTNSMYEAAKNCDLKFNTFKRYAKQLGVYNPNSKNDIIDNLNKHRGKRKQTPINEIIFENKHPLYGTTKLKERLIKENCIEYKCNKCGISKWNNEKIVLHLEHIDGNSLNHHISNLTLLCPNCHSQTKTYCRGHGRRKINKASDEEILEAISNNTSIRSVLINVGLSTAMPNYKRVNKLMEENNISLKDKKIIKKEKLVKGNCITCSKNLYKDDQKYCSYECHKFDLRKVKDRPSKEDILEELKNSSYVALGKKYKVSDNTIRNWCR